MSARSRSSSSSGPSVSSGRPVASVTSSASCSEAIPAATTGSTATWARSASSVTKASCSTCWRRPSARWGVSPRYQSAVQAAASSWPSQASRPYTFTSSERPSGASAVAMATPRGSSGAWRSPLASTVQVGQGVGDLVEGEATRRGAEQQMDDGRRPDPDREGRHHPDGKGGLQRDGGQRPDPDHRPPHVPERPGQVGGGHDDHRGGQRQPHRHIDRRRARRGQRPDAFRPVGPGQPPGDQCHPERERPRPQLLEQQAFAPAGEQRQGDQHQRPDEQQVVGDLPEPAEQSREAPDQARHQRIDRGRPGRREGQHRHREHGEDQQHHIGRAPRPRGVGGRREHADTPPPPARRRPSRTARTRWRDSATSLRLRHRPSSRRRPGRAGRPTGSLMPRPTLRQARRLGAP